MKVEEYVARLSELLGGCGSLIGVQMRPIDAWGLIGACHWVMIQPTTPMITRDSVVRLEAVLVDELERQAPGIGRLLRAGRRKENADLRPGQEVVL